MGQISELYRYLYMDQDHESNWTDAKRRALPWYHPYKIPYFQGSQKYCRDVRCPETNWGGYDRVHLRGDDCPAYEYQGRHREVH